MRLGADSTAADTADLQRNGNISECSMTSRQNLFRTQYSFQIPYAAAHRCLRFAQYDDNNNDMLAV